MFTSFDENVFRQAIKDKDYLRLKVNTVSSMLDDPTFERGETMKVIKILEEQVPEIFEEYKELGYEKHLEFDAWDKRYFTKLTYWFQENFAKERIAYIMEVGKIVHKDTAKKYNESNAMSSKQEERPSQFTKVPSVTQQLKQSEKIVQKASQSDCLSHPTSKQQKKNGSSFNNKRKEEKTGNFSTTGVILTVGALVIVGILLFKFLVK